MHVDSIVLGFLVSVFLAFVFCFSHSNANTLVRARHCAVKLYRSNPTGSICCVLSWTRCRCTTCCKNKSTANRTSGVRAQNDGGRDRQAGRSFRKAGRSAAESISVRGASTMKNETRWSAPSAGSLTATFSTLSIPQS